MVGKASLIFVIGFALIMGYIMLNLSSLGTRATANVSWYNAATTSKNLASIGANVGLSKLYQDIDITTTILAEQTIDDGEYAGGWFRVYWDHEELLMTSVSRYKSPTGGGLIRDTVEVSFAPVKKDPFTFFAYMTNNEAPNIWWVTGEKIYGRVHSNTDLRVSGSPEFFGKVTVAGKFIPPPGQSTGWGWNRRSNDGIYHQGYESGISVIEWPNDFEDLYNAANTGGRYYDEDEIWIELDPGTSADSDGRAYIRRSSGGTPGDTIDVVHLDDSSFKNYGVIGGRGRVYVEGTLSGQLTIASFQQDVYIADHITYQNPTESVFDSELNTYIDEVQGDDLLGLVARRRIRVSEKNKDGDPFMNPIIHASVFALEDGFGAENYNSGGDRGELTILGALIQEQRNAVGQISGWHKTGYYKHYMYDIRLRDTDVHPPYFPGFMPSTFRIYSWYESIQIPSL